MWIGWKFDETTEKPDTNFCSKHLKGCTDPWEPLLDPRKEYPHWMHILSNKTSPTISKWPFPAVVQCLNSTATRKSRMRWGCFLLKLPRFVKQKQAKIYCMLTTYQIPLVLSIPISSISSIGKRENWGSLRIATWPRATRESNRVSTGRQD